MMLSWRSEALLTLVQIECVASLPTIHTRQKYHGLFSKSCALLSDTLDIELCKNDASEKL
jgi:hypothetical protein